jgi:hypothetical protein
LSYRYHYDPNQRRIPAGHQEGGQWTSDGSGRMSISEPALLNRHRSTSSQDQTRAGNPSNGFGHDGEIVQAGLSFPVSPGAGPYPIPPFAYPGTRENKIWTENAISAAQGLLNFIRKICREKSCDYQYYEIDTPICVEIAREFGNVAGTRCHASAMRRYAACLRGEPMPPLDQGY